MNSLTLQTELQAELQAHLLVPDVRCAGCCLAIEKALAKMPGVEKVNVSFAEKRLSFAAQDAEVLARVQDRLLELGYPAIPDIGGEALQAHKRERRRLLARLGVAGIGMMQVMMFAFTSYLAGPNGIDPAYETLMRWAAMIVTIPVALYAAIPFHQAALRDLRNRSLGMDVPVSIAILCAFTFSVHNTLMGTGEVYFDSACMFTFFLLTGRYLELAARANFHVEQSLGEHLLPEFALTPDGEPVAINLLRAGDRLRISAGEAIPADCVVLEGSVSVDESAFTGEAEPLRRTPGEKLLAGARIHEGSVIVQVTGVRADWVITHLSEAYRRAATFKPAFAVLADRIARYFVATILMLAAGATLFWWWMGSANYMAIGLSVLVVSCPCALSLATPVAYTIATGAVRKLGILVSSGEFLEKIDQVDHVIFDKTGTLTTGDMALAEVRLESDLSRAAVINLAAAIEQDSEHPIAVALRQRATQVHEVQDRQATPGEGVAGRIDAHEYRVGKAHFVSEATAAPDTVSNWVALARDGEVLAWMKFADQLREGASEIVNEMKRQRKSVDVFSGDSSERGCEQVSAMGLATAHMGVSPAEKIVGVQALQAAGKRVLMVGDGLNDAGALAAADVSLAVNPVDTVVQAASNATLVQKDLDSLPALFRYAKRVHAVIRQNLFWAAAYNLSVIPLAIAGMLPPWVAALGMSLSSLLVTLNACRLSRTA